MDPVPSRVGVELKEEAELVPIRRQNILEKVVRGPLSLLEAVTLITVLVSVHTCMCSVNARLWKKVKEVKEEILLKSIF
jgi:hypothetical protein